MRRLPHSVLVLAVIGSLAFLPAHAYAQPSAVEVVGLYMTTQEAYDAYSSPDNSPAPPKVAAFPVGVANVGVYIHYRNAKAHKTSYRVGFRLNGSEVRHGSLHTAEYVAGETVLSIPADALQARGTYKATLYIDGKAAQTVAFAVLRTPTVDSAYMITAKAWDAWVPNSKVGPPKATSFPAEVQRVGAYFSYSGMAKTDVHYVAVYNAIGKSVHRSHDNTLSYTPDGTLAIILPADDGSYPKGHYRTDLYVKGAMVKSLSWSAR